MNLLVQWIRPWSLSSLVLGLPRQLYPLARHCIHVSLREGYSPQILVGMCRRKVKNGPELHGRAWKCGAPDRAWAALSVKMRVSGPSLSRVERENAGLRTELEPCWAWKCGSPELPGCIWLALWPAVGGYERVEIKDILKMMVSGTAKNVKWWCSGPDFLVICENDMLRNRNLGLKMGVSCAAHTQYAYMEDPPPPPRVFLFLGAELKKLVHCCLLMHKKLSFLVARWKKT